MSKSEECYIIVHVRRQSFSFFRLSPGFESCLGNIPVHKDCPEEYVWRSVTQHDDTISTVMDGFNAGVCRCKFISV